MNLITDPWIPVVSIDGRRKIRPDQIAEPDILRPDWPRLDLNLACYELLIGLMYLSDPPEDLSEWKSRMAAPDIDRLRNRLATFAHAFELLGDGPRFMQDLDLLQEGKPIPPEALFIDSAGDNARKNNTDLMVHRDRYGGLEPGLAAMALYTMQAFAPVGGAGIRASMRGGGPMVTLVEPRNVDAVSPMWSLVWANVPDGMAVAPENVNQVLPWMRPTQVSDKAGTETYPPDCGGIPVECFFGMPRRLRLTSNEAGMVDGVIQRPRGTNYVGWIHPLTPHYRQKPAAPLLPLHPQPGGFGYRNWIGPVLEDPDGLRVPAHSVQVSRRRLEDATLLIGGWDMDKNKPRSFLISRQPRVKMEGEAIDTLIGLIEAADQGAKALVAALRHGLGIDASDALKLDDLREEYFEKSKPVFDAQLRALEKGAAADSVARDWIAGLESIALGIYDREVLPNLHLVQLDKAEARFIARRNIRNAFLGRTDLGRKMYRALGLSPPQESNTQEKEGLA